MMKREKIPTAKISTAVGLGAFAAVAIISFPGLVGAETRRLAGSAFCQPEQDLWTVPIGDGYLASTVDRDGARIISRMPDNVIACGFPSDDLIAHQDVDSILVRGFRAGSGNFLSSGVQACVGSFSGSEQCGATRDFGDPHTGTFTYGISDLSAWGNASWYPYLRVRLQREDRIHGFTVTIN